MLIGAGIFWMRSDCLKTVAQSEEMGHLVARALLVRGVSSAG